MKKILSMLLLCVLLAGLCANAFAAASQVTDAGGIRWYDKDGNQVTVLGSFAGNANAWVEMGKTVTATGVENEFIVTMDVKTKQDISTLSSETPDAATVLVIDVSNSMNVCVACGEDLGGTVHNGETVYYCPGQTTNTYQKERNGNDCRNCGQLRNEHDAVLEAAECSVNKSRMEEAKDAAIEFVKEFGTNTGAQDGDKRMVAVVLYGSNAWHNGVWYDAATAGGLASAEAYIESISLRNGNSNSSYGGTNIEGGLMLAKNVLNAGLASGGRINGFDYLYTILLTDGEPTYHVNSSSSSTTQISGTQGNNGSNTEKVDAQDVGDEADAIRALGGKGLSKLYSICLGKNDGVNVWNDTPFGNWSDINPTTTNSMTIGQWLAKFSTAAYNGEATGLFESFESVMYQIQLAAKAWRVEDWMGDHITYLGKADVDNGQGGTVFNSANEDPDEADYATHSEGTPDYVWNILGSEPTSDSLIVHEDGSVSGYVGYTYKYKIRLENQDLAYHNALLSNNGSIVVNDLATLKYVVTDDEGNWPSSGGIHTAEFAQPKVKGLLGELVFDKVDQNGDPIHGDITFRLVADHYDDDGVHSEAEWEYADATTDENGRVTFKNIPSGHEYTLIEAETDFDEGYNYVDGGDIPVNVDWGVANANLSDLDNDNVHELVNTMTEKPLASITLQKAFGTGSVIPHSIKLLITGKNTLGETVYTAERTLYEADANTSGVWEWTLTDLDPDLTYTVEETNAQDANSNPLKNTHNLSWVIEVNGTQVDADTYRAGDASTYPVMPNGIVIVPGGTATVRFTNTMTPKVGRLTVNKEYDGLPAGTTGNAVTITVTPKDGSGAKTIELSSSNNWTHTFENLPIGEYTVTESALGDVGDYKYVYNEFISGGTTNGNSITVSVVESSEASVRVVNHYTQKLGTIVVTKDFTTDSALNGDGALMSTKVIKATLYDSTGKATEIELSNENNWTRIVPNLPLGNYAVVEDVGSAAVDHYDLEISYDPDTTVTLNGQTVQAAVGTITADGQRVLLDIWNEYTQKTDTITVRKSFTGDLNTDSLLLAEKEFTVTIWDASQNPVETLKLNKANGWAATSKELGHGETYTLTEEDGSITDYDWTNTIYVDGSDTAGNIVVLTDEANVAIVNNYEVHKGSAQISKTISGIDAADMPEKITVILTNDESKQEYTVELNEGNKWQAVLDNLPVGDYTVKEGADAQVSGYDLEATFTVGSNKLSENETFKITQNTQISMSIENEYEKHTGTLTVKKVINGSDNLKNSTANKTYTVYVLDKDGKEAAKLELKGTSWEASVELPLGTYTLLEESNSAQVDGYSLQVNYSGPVEIDKDNAVETATVTNNYTVNNGTLTLVKHNAGNTAEMPAEISFSIVSDETDSGVTYNGVMTLNALNSWSASLSLEPGTYKVTEDTSNLDVPVDIIWTGSGVSNATATGVTVTIHVGSNATASVVCTNDYEYLHDLTFTKLNSYDNSPMSGVEFTLEHKVGHDADGSVTCNENIASVTAESGKDGVVKFEKIEAGHVYTLTETVPNGFTGMDPVTVTVSDRGVTVTGGMLDYVVYNTPDSWPTENLIFTKIDEQTGDEIEGTVFELKHSDSCPSCSGQPSGELAKTWTATTGSNGKAEFTGLPVKHTYTLTETKHEGYLHNGPWSVVVSEDSVTLTGPDVGGTGRLLEGYTITNTPTVYNVTEISFKKYSSYTNAPLAGAVFTLTHSENCVCNGWPTGFETTMTATSAADGTVEFVNVPTHHTYILSETTAPSGYTGMADAVVTVDDDANGEVTITGLTTVNGVIYNDLTNWPTTDLEFTKRSSVDNAVIAGIEFTLTHSNNCDTCKNMPSGVAKQPANIDAWTQHATSDSNGIVKFTGIPQKHVYTLTETDGNGYEQLAPIAVHVTDSDVLMEGVTDKTIYNTPSEWPVTDISFYKHSTYLQGPLAGVTFMLEHHENCICSGNPADVETKRTAVSDANGLVEFKNVPEGHAYLLSESTPSGYQAVGPWKVNVYSDNHNPRITGLPVNSENILYNEMSSWPGRDLEFKKYSRLTNGPIAGIEFTITHSCAAGTCIGLPEGIEQQSWKAVSDAQGSVKFTNLPVKHVYTLTETKHDGYQALAPMTVTVTENGVTVEGMPADKILYNVPSDWPTTTLSFYKYSNYMNAPLEGVKFTLTHSDACADCSGIPEEIKTAKEAVSDATGLVKFENVPTNHTYVISETAAPVGYEKMKDLTVTVKQGAEGISVTGLENGSVIYNVRSDWPTEDISFTKISAFDGRVLAGATFDLVHVNDKNAAEYCCDEAIDIAEATTDMYGKVTLTGVPRQHIYKLVETKAPEGYKAIEPMIVSVEEGAPVTIGGAELTAGFTIKDDPIYWPIEVQLTASKTMDGKTPTDKYTFVLSNASGEIERVANNAGAIVFSKYLFEKPGTYTFTVHELPGENATVVYDGSVYTAAIHVTADADGRMSAQVSLKKDGLAHEGGIEFANMTMPELPATGDNSKIVLWFALLALAGAGIVLMKRRNA